MLNSTFNKIENSLGIGLLKLENLEIVKIDNNSITNLINFQ